MSLCDGTDDTFWFANCFGQSHPYHMKNFSVHHSSFLPPFPLFAKNLSNFLAVVILSSFVTNNHRRKGETGYGTNYPFCQESPKPFSCSPFVECNEPYKGYYPVKTTGRKDQMDGLMCLSSFTYRGRRRSSTLSVILMHSFPIVIIIGFPRMASFCVKVFLFHNR